MAKLSQYFENVNDSVVFVGETMSIKIPRRYEDFDLLFIENMVKSLAIFEVTINEKITTGYLLPAVIVMEPSEITKLTEDDTDYYLLKFKKGDKFMLTRTLLKQSHIAYVMFLEFISLGNFPKFLTYEQTAFLFDRSAAITGMKIGVNHAVFEMIYAHLFRSSKDLSVKYRHTDMTEPPTFIELRSVAYGTDSTTAKLVGAYFGDGVNSALINHSDQRHDLEDLLRT